MTDSRAHSFNAAAARYAAYRPSYPPALFDAIERLTARPLRGAQVIDVGAGTGIGTARLLERGARVLAVEPGDGMAAQFRRDLPTTPLVRGDGNALPVADSSADLVTYAQSWHWTDPARSAPEALRVLRPGGSLALWWNMTDHTVPWHAAQARRIAHRLGAHSGAHGSATRSEEAAPGLDFRTARVHWTRRIPLDTHLANLSSHSALLVLASQDAAAFLDQERHALLREFPDGTVEESYTVELLVTTRTATT